MPNLAKPMNEVLTRVLAERNLTLIDDRDPAIAPGDPASIVSGLPFIRVDTGRDAYAGRRRRLTLSSGDGSATVLARTRPLPQEPEGGWLLVESARDRFDRKVPVCAVDPSAHKVLVLLELSTASVLHAPAGLDPWQTLAETFVGRPLSLMLRHAPRPSVGPDVPRHVRALLDQRPVEERDALQGELSMLRNFAPAGALPRALARRLEALKRALGERRKHVSDARVTIETARMTKLVSSRALAAIRLGRERIEGLINPAPLDAECRLRPVMFRLQLGYTPLHPILQTWNPLRPVPGRGHGHCLGEAQPVFHEMDGDGDLFSLVDTVINFRETNLIRAMPTTEPTSRVDRLADALAPLF
jgi:hypothetical protein